MVLNCGYTFEKYSVALPYKEGDAMLNGCTGSGERSQSLEISFPHNVGIYTVRNGHRQELNPSDPVVVPALFQSLGCLLYAICFHESPFDKVYQRGDSIALAVIGGNTKIPAGSP